MAADNKEPWNNREYNSSSSFGIKSRYIGRMLVFIVLVLFLILLCGGFRSSPSTILTEKTASQKNSQAATETTADASTISIPKTTSATVSNKSRIVQCYQNAAPINSNIELLDDILNSTILPEGGPNIFFHETSCLNGTISVDIRQACAVESAALANPTSNVFLLFASAVGFVRGEERPAHIRALHKYPNVHWRNVNLWKYAENTPAEKFMKDQTLFKSKYLSAHMSDLFRFLSLYKWGGTHVDLDFIVRRSLSNVSQNYAGDESKGLINGALLNFDEDGIGHFIAKSCLKEYAHHFDGNVWGANGPGLLTRVLHDICKTKDLSTCPIFMIYPSHVFYAIYYPRWQWFFDPDRAADVLAAVSDSMAVHFWNKFSITKRVKIGENSAYELLAKEFCPEVYNSIVGDSF